MFPLSELQSSAVCFRVKGIQSDLSTQVMVDFKEAFEGPNSKVKPNLSFITAGVVSRM